MRLSRPAHALLAFVVMPLSMPALAAERAAPPTPTVVEIRGSHHEGFDRVVLELDGPLPASRRVRYVDRLVAGGSGLPVRVAGRAILRVRLEPAQAHDAGGQPTSTRRRAFALPNVMTVVRASDFEGVTTYGIGLARRTPFDVFTLRNPSRVVVDVRAGFPTVQRSVWFFHQDRFIDNREPFFVPRSRPVPAGARAAGLMDRLFAGVLPRERARGLRLLRSEATSWADLETADRIARVRLTGGCDSRGSTVSIAGEIMPTLRQLAVVDWVKIYGPGGRTASPNGPSDSIPGCLNP